MIGMQQPPRIPGLNGHAVAQPVINGFFPPVNDTIWCGDWTPAERIEQPETGEDLTPEATALAEVEQVGNG
jgi:hypothetical protein